jgi:hypothetical protein
MTAIYAPWTAEQINNLTTFQRSGSVHPFTCGRRDEHRDNPGVLIATEAGWVCPVATCEFQQNWAHAFMANPLPVSDPNDLLTRAREENKRGREAIVRVAELEADYAVVTDLAEARHRVIERMARESLEFEAAVNRVQEEALRWSALAPADDWGATPSNTVLADAGRYLLTLLDRTQPGRQKPSPGTSG